MSLARIPTVTLLLAAGLVVGLTAIGFISVAEEAVHAPRWVIGLLTAIFVSAGVATLVGSESRLARWSAGTVVISMTVVSAWVSLFGASERFSGDWPALSRGTNVLIARLLFGCVSLLGLAMIVSAAKKTWRKRDG